MDIKNFLDTVCEQIKYKPVRESISEELKKEYGAKSDMILTGIDSFDRSRTTVGFSIKSHMGSSPTLYNSSTNSGFVYLLKGCNDDLLHRINGSGKFLEKISFITSSVTVSPVIFPNSSIISFKYVDIISIGIFESIVSLAF